jgi:putative two-component system response regulator
MSDGQKIIMLVDDNSTNLAMGKEMLKDDYKVYPIPSGAILLDLLENVTPDLILLDVEMPDKDGYEVLRILKSNPKHEHIPVIFLTTHTDEQSEYHGLSLGAIDYVAKPFSEPLLRQRIENQLAVESYRKRLQEFNDNLAETVRQKTEENMGLQNTLLNIITDLVEFRDEVTGGHVVRTTRYLELMLDQMTEDGVYADDIAPWDRTACVLSAKLHDVGKIGISDAILNKPGKLTDAEFEIMKKHVNIGIKVIERMGTTEDEHSFLRYARQIIAAHHERWDGKGYPAGLKELDIPLEGRLMAIGDVYDALISQRPYKAPFSAEEAREIIERDSGIQFDPALVSVFSTISNQFADVVRQYI